MNITECKKSIKKIIDSTDDEALLKFWKLQLEHDIENGFEFNIGEWELEEEPQDLSKGKIISLNEFIRKKESFF